jgi:hypothetical protein
MTMNVCAEPGQKVPACPGVLRRLRAITPIPGVASGAPAAGL